MSMHLFATRWMTAVALAALGWTSLLAAQQPQRPADSDEGYAAPRPTAAARATGPTNDPDNGYAAPRIPGRGAAAEAPTAVPAAGDAGLPAPPPAGAKDVPQDETQQEREWLVAYLIAHQGYRIDQMDSLEKRIGKMSATQVHTLVDLYQQKHELALQREKSNQAARHQAFNLQTADYNQRLKDEQTARSEIDSAANAEQSRLNTQQSQAMQNIQESNLFHGPSYMGYGNPLYGGYYGGGMYGGGMYHDRYWH